MAAADFASRPDYGHCPVCGEYRQVTKKGVMRHHAGPPGSEPGRLYGKNRAYRCDGAGQTPKGD
jgi:hypothetical protein